MKFCIALCVCLLSLSVAAQQPVPRPSGPPPAPVVAAAPPVPPAPPASPREEGKAINIRLDVSVIDQTGSSIPQPKALMVMLRDGSLGRTRAAFENRSISVDARPLIVDGRIRVDLTIQSDAVSVHMPVGAQNDGSSRDQTLSWRNGFSLMLENAKPMITLETSDAVTKRKMSIEVKATIQK